jgi:hypothetical protein
VVDRAPAAGIGSENGIHPFFRPFIFRFEDSLEAADHVLRVAWRLNRLGVQRAVYRSVAAVLIAATAAAVCAAYLPPVWFRALLGILVVSGIAIVTASAFGLKSHWARAVDAARWVESRVGLEDRLLTLVSASPQARTSRLWPELVRDNEVQLPRWRDRPLDIPNVPRSLAAMVAAVILALVFLVPWDRDDFEPPPLGLAPSSQPGPGPQQAAQQPKSSIPPEPGSAVVHGVGGDGASGSQSGPSSAMAAVDQIQSELDRAFRRSFGGQVVTGKPEQPDVPEEEEATAFRGDSPESGIGDTESQPGGAQPAEGLARREDGAATGPAVKSLDPGGDGSSGGSGKSGASARPAKPGGEGSEKKDARGSATQKKSGTGDGPKAVADGAAAGASGAGGAGAGSGKATGPLLADAPLTLSGDRQSASFALTLGAAAGKAGDDGEAELVAAPRSRIAEGQRGEQAADRQVRREEVPPEYEGIVKRVFERGR